MPDTYALLWWTMAPARLSTPAAAACRTIGSDRRVQVSSISIWEVGLLCQRQRLDLGMPLRGFVRRLSETSVVDVVPVSAEDWMASLELDWDHRDPADRVIVALALRSGADLVTADERIRGFYPRTVW